MLFRHYIVNHSTYSSNMLVESTSTRLHKSSLYLSSSKLITVIFAITHQVPKIVSMKYTNKHARTHAIPFIRLKT